MAAALLTSCSAGISPSAPSPMVSISTAGTVLVEGADDVPPSLDLALTGAAGLADGDVGARLDGAVLPLARRGGDLSGVTAPLPLGSGHRLDILVAGRVDQTIDFHVVGPTGAMAAVHDAPAGPVVDISFERAPSRAAVEHALGAATITWHDDQRLSLSWSGSAPLALDLPAGLPAARGSRLAASLHLDLRAPGLLRRVTVPPAPPPSPMPVVAFSVGTAASRAAVAAHVRQLAELAPSGWRLSTGGRLIGAPDAPSVAAAAAAGVPVWPLLQNDSSDPDTISALLNDDAAATRLAGDIGDAAAAGGFPGIHLDLEGVPAADRDRLTAFVHRLAVALHRRGSHLAVDVIPHRPDHVNRYSAAYDEPAIAREADVVALLAYDQHAASSDPGPVAALDWQSEVLDGTLPGVPPAHALLGIPLYARTWDGGSSAPGAHDDAVAAALAHPGATVDYDFSAATPLARWRSVDGGYSATYFDDADSISRKLVLARRRGLGGVALWRLGFEDPGLWGLLGR